MAVDEFHDCESAAYGLLTARPELYERAKFHAQDATKTPTKAEAGEQQVQTGSLFGLEVGQKSSQQAGPATRVTTDRARHASK